MAGKIPMFPLPVGFLEKMPAPLLSIGNKLSKAFPSLNGDLYIAELPFTTTQYLSAAFFSFVFYFSAIFAAVAGLTAFVAEANFFLAAIISLLFSVFIFAQIMAYPKILISKKTRAIDSDLLPALYHLMIEVKSGVPLFNALVGLSQGYGSVSAEFKKIISRINGGVSETEALDTASERNPSIFFRRGIMQIVNSMKAGGGIASALESIVDNLKKEQMINVKKYSQELNPIIMMYMLIAVIMPTLGLTFLIVLSSFSGAQIPDIALPAAIFGLAFFQFLFVGVVKSKRPAIGV